MTQGQVLITAGRIIDRVLHGFEGSLAVRLWNGEHVSVGADGATTTLVINEPGVLRDLVLRPDPFRLADHYVAGRVELEGDIFAALRLKSHLEGLVLSLRERLQLLGTALMLPRWSAGDTRSQSHPP